MGRCMRPTACVGNHLKRRATLRVMYSGTVRPRVVVRPVSKSRARCPASSAPPHVSVAPRRASRKSDLGRLSLTFPLVRKIPGGGSQEDDQ